MAKQVILPKLGQTMEQGAIVEWLKEEGDTVKRGEVLFTVESDKAMLEVEATARGVLRKILVPPGVTVPVLTPVAIIARTMDENIETLLAPEKEPPTPAASPSPAKGERIFASPRARMRAREHGVDLASIQGSGPNGRIVEKDVLTRASLASVASPPRATPMARRVAAELGVDLGAVEGSGIGGKITKADVEQAVPAAPAPALAQPETQAVQPPPAEVAATLPLSGLRGIIAERMATSARQTAHVTLMAEADATTLVEVRAQLKATVTEEWGFAPGYNDLLGIIVARALRQFPYMNARLNGDVIEHVAHINLGMAVDTERGLLVPVIGDADQKGLRAFGAAFRALVERARAGRSLPDDFAGGTFTVTNLGMYGVDAFTPIINLPEAAILGAGRIQPKPVVYQGQIAARQMWTLSLTFDHRLVDGAPAARFLQHITQLIENPYLLLA